MLHILDELDSFFSCANGIELASSRMVITTRHAMQASIND